jgi:hypothetical protein
VTNNKLLWFYIRRSPPVHLAIFPSAQTDIQLNYTGLFEMIVGVLTTCHTQHTSDSSICIYLFNRKTLPVFVTYLTGALYVHRLWLYKHQHDYRVRSKQFVACQRTIIKT